LSLRHGAGEIGPVEAEERVRLAEHAEAPGIEILCRRSDEPWVRARETDAALLVTDHGGTEGLDERNAAPPAVIVASVPADEHQRSLRALEDRARRGDVSHRRP